MEKGICSEDHSGKSVPSQSNPGKDHWLENWRVCASQFLIYRNNSQFLELLASLTFKPG